MSIIPYGRQDITPEDIAAVVEVLQSDWLTQGPKIPEFEAALASYCGAQYAVVVSSATAALHLACIAAGLKGGRSPVDITNYLCCLRQLWPLLWCHGGLRRY